MTVSEQSTETDGKPFADDYTVVEDSDHALELLSELSPKETMLEIDESPFISIDHGRSYVRAFDGHDDEYQVRLWMGGAPIWEDPDDLAERLVDCPVALVDYRRTTEV